MRFSAHVEAPFEPKNNDTRISTLYNYLGLPQRCPPLINKLLITNLFLFQQTWLDTTAGAAAAARGGTFDHHTISPDLYIKSKKKHK